MHGDSWKDSWSFILYDFIIPDQAVPAQKK